MKKEGRQCASVYYAVISAEDEVYVNTHLGIHRVLIRSTSVESASGLMSI